MRTYAKDIIAIERERAKGSLLFVLGVLGLMGAGGYAADLVPWRIVVEASGSVIAPSRVQAIGSAEGGLVTRVLVRPYDDVQAGQPLVELDAAVAEADQDRIGYAAHTARADVLRLEAELAGAAPDLSGLPDEIASAAKKAWEVRIKKHADELAAKESEAAALRSSQLSYVRSLSAGEAVLARLQFGAAEGVIAQNRADDQLRQVEEMRGRVSKGVSDIASVSSQIAALRGTQQETAAKELAEARGKLHEAEQQLKKAGAQERHTVLRAPVSGRIKTLTTNGPGMAVKPGEMVAEIVEGSREKRVEARMEARDVGLVKEGDTVFVRLAGDDGSHEGISGRVLALAPDSVADKNGRLTTAMEISVQAEAFPGRGNARPRSLADGLPVEVTAQYGERSLFQMTVGRWFGQSERWREGR